VISEALREAYAIEIWSLNIGATSAVDGFGGCSPSRPPRSSQSTSSQADRPPGCDSRCTFRFGRTASTTQHNGRSPDGSPTNPRIFPLYIVALRTVTHSSIFPQTFGTDHRSGSIVCNHQPHTTMVGSSGSRPVLPLGFPFRFFRGLACRDAWVWDVCIHVKVLIVSPIGHHTPLFLAHSLFPPSSPCLGTTRGLNSETTDASTAFIRQGWIPDRKRFEASTCGSVPILTSTNHDTRG